MLSLMGAEGPRLSLQGKIGFCLLQQRKSCSKISPPPKRVKPLPAPTLHFAFAALTGLGPTRHLAITEMMLIAFFFLL